jgi:hypothetical protein
MGSNFRADEYSKTAGKGKKFSRLNYTQVFAGESLKPNDVVWLEGILNQRVEKRTYFRAV